jgi:hypothetical protein
MFNVVRSAARMTKFALEPIVRGIAALTSKVSFECDGGSVADQSGRNTIRKLLCWPSRSEMGRMRR